MTDGAPQETISVRLEPQAATAAPSALATWTVHLRNDGASPAKCRLAATGEVAAWAWFNPPEAVVEPGAESVVKLGVRVPPPPEPPAGSYPFVVEVRVDGAATPVTTAAGQLEIAPLLDVSAFFGRSRPGSGEYPLTVANRGNAPLRASLTGGEGNGLAVTVEPSTIDVRPGDVATAVVSVKGRGSGAPFEVHIRPETGDPIVVEGTHTGGGKGGRARRPAWWFALPASAAVAVLAAVLMRGGGDSQDTVISEAPTGPTIPAATVDPGSSQLPVPPGDTPLPECPLRDHLAADAAGQRRINVPVPRDYAFLEGRPGGCQPVRFDPCEPIHYVVNDTLAPPGGMRDIEMAFERLSQATGITFVYDGSTPESTDGRTRPSFQPSTYGPRWAPILIAWDHGRSARLDPTNPGGGRPTNVQGVYVSGFLILNVDAINADRRPLPTGFGPGATWGRVILHELAHVLGLGHVSNPQHLMFEELGGQGGQADFAAGDRLGLRIVGREAGCLPAPPVPAAIPVPPVPSVPRP